MSTVYSLANTNNLESENFHYTLTCFGFPEQYDVYEKGTDNVVAYIRLRHSHLTVECPDCGGELVFECEYDDPGDNLGMKGTFDSLDERIETLSHIDDVLCKYYNIKK